MRLLAIDPGPEQSAYVVYDTRTGRPSAWEKTLNDSLLGTLNFLSLDVMAIECVASYGMSVGAETFETCVWEGRFIERWLAHHPQEPMRLFRRDCKSHLCHSQRATDTNIRQALIDRYGPGREKAVGKKKNKGPLYGMKADCWQALAVAVTAAETRLDERAAA